jgi:Resolvase, N terminal domain
VWRKSPRAHWTAAGYSRALCRLQNPNQTRGPCSSQMRACSDLRARIICLNRMSRRISTERLKRIRDSHVSTDHQTTENQERKLQAIAEGIGWTVVKVYRDQGVSGAKSRQDRPASDALSKDARGHTRRETHIYVHGPEPPSKRHAHLPRCNLRRGDVSNRRKADITDPGLRRLNWAESGPKRDASGRNGLCALAVIQLRSQGRKTRGARCFA